MIVIRVILRYIYWYLLVTPEDRYCRLLHSVSSERSYWHHGVDLDVCVDCKRYLTREGATMSWRMFFKDLWKKDYIYNVPVVLSSYFEP